MSNLIELVMLNGEKGNLIAKAPFGVVKSGDMVMVDDCTGWYKVVTKVLNYDSEMKDFLLRFYGVDYVDELSSIIEKRIPIEWGEGDEF